MPTATWVAVQTGIIEVTPQTSSSLFGLLLLGLFWPDGLPLAVHLAQHLQKRRRSRWEYARDALAAAGNYEDGVHVFITRPQATRAWARHCRRRHRDGCHKTRDPTAHPSDADSDTDGNTESAGARASRQQASAPTKHKRTAAMELLKRERGASTPPTASVLVKRAVTRTPAPALKPDTPSPEKKISLYADIEDSDGDLFASDSSADVPLAATLAASCTGSWATSVLSSLHEDEDVPMPAAAPMPAGPPVSPTVSSVSSLLFLDFEGIASHIRRRRALCSGSRRTARHAHALQPGDARPLRRPQGCCRGKKPGESMEVVEAGKFLSWISTLGRSANMLYNRNTKVLYDDLKAAVEERTPGESMQVVEPDELVEWISTLGSLGK
ncbi:hypothetical protein K438DRAFT_1786193 [Mycena galopus ATCC 62051]|nr:hypothetical protein K438DRAFT_1786193 [Mycena galopus ATCC 62051]